MISLPDHLLAAPLNKDTTCIAFDGDQDEQDSERFRYIQMWGIIPVEAVSYYVCERGFLFHPVISCVVNRGKGTFFPKFIPHDAHCYSLVFWYDEAKDAWLRETIERTLLEPRPDGAASSAKDLTQLRDQRVADLLSANGDGIGVFNGDQRTIDLLVMGRSATRGAALWLPSHLVKQPYRHMLQVRGVN